LIHKFLTPEMPLLSIEECTNLLKRFQFKNIVPAARKSTFEMFEADYHRDHYFVKIAPADHILGKNLKLQGEILNELYPQLELKLFQSSKLVGLAITELEKMQKYSFQEIEEALDQSIKSNRQLLNMIPPNRNIFSLIEIAYTATKFFTERKIISFEISEKVIKEINHLFEYVSAAAQIVNHGDLSNPNIPILLDWEDVMIGYSGYDQIYWLTFFANANEITVENLKRISGPSEVMRATFSFVVILKEYLFALKGESQNRTSTQQRLKDLSLLPIVG
jgi:hypothetical protein